MTQQGDITPALTADEWRAVLSNADSLGEVKAGFSQSPFTAHALCAILLYAEPYGFSPQDVSGTSSAPRKSPRFCHLCSYFFSFSSFGGREPFRTAVATGM